jgi:pseudaminic acid biosynthesis-associated methylase
VNNQEALWRGGFGKAYTERQCLNLLGTRVFFRRALKEADCTNLRALEFGANVGTNLLALRRMYEDSWLSGVEINESAFGELQLVANEAYLDSILDFEPRKNWNLVLSKGLLIHVAPENLVKAYRALYECSRRYILIAEYYSPRVENVEYRGKRGALWRGPHAEQMLDLFPLKVLDYGFWWRKDKYPQDDLTWFLMERE